MFWLFSIEFGLIFYIQFFKGKNMKHKRQIKRQCIVCDKRFSSAIYSNGKYSNGHYFGKMKVPIGKGKYKKTSSFKLGKKKYGVVKWTGKEKELEYWECNSCFEQASNECWREKKIETLFGKRCSDYEQDCAVCQAWSIYDAIREANNQKT